jgi:c-di-GMP-related signal transduction protein
MLELLKTYPEAAKVVKTYYLEKMLESLNDESLPENFKEFAREMGLEDDRLAGILEASPRALFDVFDDNELYIQITGDNKIGWFWEVEANNDNKCSTRKEAETEAVQECFRILNERICQTQS